MTKIQVRDTSGLPAQAVALLRDGARAIARGDIKSAQQSITLAMVFAPQHAETLRLLGHVQMQQSRFADASATFRSALASRPGGSEILLPLAQCEALTNHVDAALEILRVLANQEHDHPTLFLIAELLERHGAIPEALSVAERASHKVPSHAPSRILHARCLVAVGRLSEAAENYRYLIRSKQEVAKAWYGLAEIKTLKLSAPELLALKDFSARHSAAGADMIAVQHALGKSLEDAGDFSAAFTSFQKTATLVRSESRWNKEAFSSHMTRVRAAFQDAACSSAATDGREVIFIVGLPRSGSTLVEQILSAHPDVEGASELPDLNAILQEESQRRQKTFPLWVADAIAEDWRRLGETYLQRTARWRKSKSRSTDKLPENWLLAEAALTMLPASTIVDCRRDAVETCWSCFKQVFAPGRVTWSYDFEDLASYWKECRLHMDHLQRRYPQRVRIQSYEDLVRDPERQTRELLSICGLDYDAACLRFFDAVRSIRTASAAQVREPMRNDTALTASYGALLAPLRDLLAARAVESGSP